MSPQPISFSDEVAKDHSRAFVQDVIVLAWGYLSCLLWQLGYPRQAEAAGRQSARRQHARLWELRAAVALARHWARTETWRRRGMCLLRFMAGSRKGWTLPICSERDCCWSGSIEIAPGPVEHQPDAERADEAARVVAAMKTDAAWRSAISL